MRHGYFCFVRFCSLARLATKPESSPLKKFMVPTPGP